MESIEQQFEYYNSIKDKKEILIIQKMPLNRIRLGNIKTWTTDKDIENIVNQLLKDITLSNLVNGMMLCKTDSPRYKSVLSEYIFYIEKFENHLKYNIYLDKLFELHNFNLDFEKNYIEPTINVKPKSKNNKKNNAKNAFYKRQTFDLFTSEPIYEYINPKTNEIIRSTNPNLVEQLNAELAKNKPKRTRTSKSEKQEKIKINKTPNFDKIKFKF